MPTPSPKRNNSLFAGGILLISVAVLTFVLLPSAKEPSASENEWVVRNALRDLRITQVYLTEDLDNAAEYIGFDTPPKKPKMGLFPPRPSTTPPVREGQLPFARYHGDPTRIATLWSWLRGALRKANFAPTDPSVANLGKQGDRLMIDVSARRVGNAVSCLVSMNLHRRVSLGKSKGDRTDVITWQTNQQLFVLDSEFLPRLQGVLQSQIADLAQCQKSGMTAVPKSRLPLFDEPIPPEQRLPDDGSGHTVIYR